ncbi:MAG TPA: hypothetical protein VEX39_09695 [Thermoleophilaceae bacterium]|nr:hypothetical protein [Thermoleophilaceae bacterium]
MLHPASPYARQECANCRAHTLGPECGCCGNPHLTPVPAAPAPALVPCAAAAVTVPAALPFTHWAP